MKSQKIKEILFRLLPLLSLTKAYEIICQDGGGCVNQSIFNVTQATFQQDFPLSLADGVFYANLNVVPFTLVLSDSYITYATPIVFTQQNFDTTCVDPGIDTTIIWTTTIGTFRKCLSYTLSTDMSVILIPTKTQDIFTVSLTISPTRQSSSTLTPAHNGGSVTTGNHVITFTYDQDYYDFSNAYKALWSQGRIYLTRNVNDKAEQNNTKVGLFQYGTVKTTIQPYIANTSLGNSLHYAHAFFMDGFQFNTQTNTLNFAGGVGITGPWGPSTTPLNFIFDPDHNHNYLITDDNSNQFHQYDFSTTDTNPYMTFIINNHPNFTYTLIDKYSLDPKVNNTLQSYFNCKRLTLSQAFCTTADDYLDSLCSCSGDNVMQDCPTFLVRDYTISVGVCCFGKCMSYSIPSGVPPQKKRILQVPWYWVPIIVLISIAGFFLVLDTVPRIMSYMGVCKSFRKYLYNHHVPMIQDPDIVGSKPKKQHVSHRVEKDEEEEYSDPDENV